MAITRFDPFRDLAALQDQLYRTFDGAFGVPDRPPPQSAQASWVPAVDVFENEHAITLKVELPEVDLKDVDVRVEGNQLSLRGEKRLEKSDEKSGYQRIERVYGSFARTFTLPDTVDVEHIGAESHNGVLRLTLPKKPETKPRAIKINVGGTLPSSATKA